MAKHPERDPRAGQNQLQNHCNDVGTIGPTLDWLRLGSVPSPAHPSTTHPHLGKPIARPSTLGLAKLQPTVPMLAGGGIFVNAFPRREPSPPVSSGSSCDPGSWSVLRCMQPVRCGFSILIPCPHPSPGPKPRRELSKSLLRPMAGRPPSPPPPTKGPEPHQGPHTVLYLIGGGPTWAGDQQGFAMQSRPSAEPACPLFRRPRRALIASSPQRNSLREPSDTSLMWVVVRVVGLPGSLSRGRRRSRESNIDRPTAYTPGFPGWT